MVMFQSPAWEQLHTGAALPGTGSLVVPTQSRIKGWLFPALHSHACTHGAHPSGNSRATCTVSLPAELSANTCMFWVTLPRGLNVFILPIACFLCFTTGAVSCSASGFSRASRCYQTADIKNSLQAWAAKVCYSTYLLPLSYNSFMVNNAGFIMCK